MGIAYLALSPEKESVVVKMISPELIRGDRQRNYLEEFREEILRMIRMDYFPNLVSIRDAWVEDRPCVAMEYVAGGNLGDLVKCSRLSLPESWLVLLQICAGMRKLHEQDKLLHLDLKPANILVGDSGILKIADFGLASGIQPGGITSLGGTLPFMAPEQLSDEHADERSDIWAVGVMLYWLATGEMPFQGQNAFTLQQAICNSNPKAPSSIRKDMDVELESIIMKCLSKLPSNRFGSFIDLQDNSLSIKPKLGMELILAASRQHCIFSLDVVRCYLGMKT